MVWCSYALRRRSTTSSSVGEEAQRLLLVALPGPDGLEDGLGGQALVDEQGQGGDAELLLLGLARPAQEGPRHPPQLGGGRLGLRQVLGLLDPGDQRLAALAIGADVPGERGVQARVVTVALGRLLPLELGLQADVGPQEELFLGVLVGLGGLAVRRLLDLLRLGPSLGHGAPPWWVAKGRRRSRRFYP